MKKIRDERILKDYDEIRSKTYVFVLFLMVLGAVVKYAMGEPQISFFYLEPIAVMGSLGYILFRHLRLGLPFFGGQDEYIRQEKQKSRARAYMICYYTYVYGNLYYVLFDFNLLVLWANLLVCFLPALWLTIVMKRRGVIIPETVLGAKEKENEDQFGRLKKLSVAMGVFSGGFLPWLFNRIGAQTGEESSLNVWLGSVVSYAVQTVLIGLFMGFCWYWAMKMLMVWSWKKSNNSSKEEK